MRTKLQVKVVRVHVMKAYVELELQLHFYLTSRLDGGEWSTSRSDHLRLGREPRYPLHRM